MQSKTRWKLLNSWTIPRWTTCRVPRKFTWKPPKLGFCTHLRCILLRRKLKTNTKNRAKRSTTPLWRYSLFLIAAYHLHSLAMQSPLSCRTSTSPETTRKSYQLPYFSSVMWLALLFLVHWVKLLVGNPFSCGLLLFFYLLHLVVLLLLIGLPFSSSGWSVGLWELLLRLSSVVCMQICFSIFGVVVAQWRRICRYVVIFCS